MKLNDGTIPTILVVDDIAINTEILAKMISKMGYTPVKASSVNEALQCIENELPQLILSDILMPDTNGYQFCEILKANAYTRKIPVVFVSAVEEVQDKKKAFEVGAVDFISKPYDFVEVAMRVNTHLQMYIMQCELEEKNRILNKIVNEQSEKLESERKKIIKALAVFSEKQRNLTNDNHLENVSYNSRLLAQGLNFTRRYENKISEEMEILPIL